MGKEEIAEKQKLKKIKKEKKLIKKVLNEVKEGVIFLEEAKQISIKNYQIFLGKIDFAENIIENYNICHENTGQYVDFKVFPYACFYNMMYVLENKKNGIKVCLFFKVELEEIFFKEIPLITLYKQKNVRLFVSKFKTDVKDNYTSQIINADFGVPNYILSRSIINKCLEKASSYITEEYFKNEIIVEEYCEKSKYIKEVPNDDVQSLENYFKGILVRKAYNKVKNGSISAKKDVAIEGAKISVEAHEEQGKRHCKIYLILNDKRHYFACCDITSNVVNIKFEVNAASYKKEETFSLYDGQVYNSTLGDVFKVVNIEDLA